MSVQDRCMVCARRTIGSDKSFWTHLMVPLGDEAQVEARFGPLEKVLILTQDRCTVFAEHTIGWEIILDTPDGTSRSCGSCGTSLLSLWRQCVGAR